MKKSDTDNAIGEERKRTIDQLSGSFNFTISSLQNILHKNECDITQIQNSTKLTSDMREYLWKEKVAIRYQLLDAISVLEKAQKRKQK